VLTAAIRSGWVTTGRLFVIENNVTVRITYGGILRSAHREQTAIITLYSIN